MAINRNIIICLILSFIILNSCSPRIGIVNENIRFTKKIFYSYTQNQNECMSGITFIKEVKFCSSSKSVAVILDQFSLHIVDPETGYLKQKFELVTGYNQDIILKNCNDFNVLSSGHNHAELINKQGNTVWSYNPKDIYISSMTKGDLNNDGELEYYLATDTGLYQLNSSMEKKWEQKGWTKDVAVLNLKKDKKSFVISRLDNGLLQYRDWNGNLIREVKPEVKISGLEICDWPDDRQNILTNRDNHIYLLNNDGKVLFRYTLGNLFDLTDNIIFDIRGVSVKLYDDQPKYLAIVLCLRSSSQKSILCVFSPEGKLVYREVINSTRGISAISVTNTSREILLVGDGPGRVYSYQPHKMG